MNNVNLTGRIGQEPTVHTFDNGEKQTSFSIAVDSGSYSKEKAEWIDRTIWINIVKRGETKLQKGDLIEVSGKLNVRSYEKENKPVYITEVVAFNTGLLNRKNNTPAENTPKAENTPDDNKPPPGDDLPFVVTILLVVGSMIQFII